MPLRLCGDEYHAQHWERKKKAESTRARRGALSYSNVSSAQFSSVTQSCPPLCEPMDCSTPGFPVHHQIVELVIESVMPSNRLILCRPLLLLPSSFPASGSFPMSHFFKSGGQSTGISASASVLPMNIQNRFPLGWTGWISLQSKGLSRVFNTTVQKHQFFGTQLSL